MLDLKGQHAKQPNVASDMPRSYDKQTARLAAEPEQHWRCQRSTPTEMLRPARRPPKVANPKNRECRSDG